MNTNQADDLKAFERRMIEILSSIQPSIWRWRITLFILIIITLITFCSLIINITCSLTSTESSSSSSKIITNDTSYLFILSSKLLRREIYFSLSFILLILSLLSGIHRKIFARSILIQRFRDVLADYNMSCDTNGRLIIKPRLITFSNGKS